MRRAGVQPFVFAALAATILITVLGVGSAPSGAAVSPAPYLDTSYNNSLWNEILDSWPTGYPASSLAPAAFDVSVAAGALPALSTLNLPLKTTGIDVGWKIVRGSSARWLHLTDPSQIRVLVGTRVTAERWEWHGPGSNQATRTGQAGGVWTLAYFGGGCGNTNGWSDKWTTPSTVTGTVSWDCNDDSTVEGAQIFPSVSGYGTVTDVYSPLTGSNYCGWANASEVAGRTGCKYIYKTAAQMEAAVIHSPTVPYTSQAFDVMTTISAPSQNSTTLANARNMIGYLGCATQNEYNASLDPLNWARPEPAGGPCGGLISQPPAQMYGPVGAVPGIDSLAENPTGALGEPVNTASGSFFSNAVDLSLPGIGVPFTFTRSYNSADPTSGRLGVGWTDSLAWALTVQTGGDVVARSGSGQQLHFALQTGGAFMPDPGGRATLVTQGSGYELVTHDQIHYLFDGNGRLTSEKDRDGQGLDLAYDGSGNLASVTDSVGRVITFTTTGGLLMEIELPDGRSVSYGYSSGSLSSFTDLRGGVVTYGYDSGGRLNSIVDQNNHTVVANTYDTSTGRVTAQTDARGHTSSFAWNPNTNTSTFTDARGKTWTETYANNVLRTRIDPLNHTISYGYDSDLNVTSVTDPLGKTTTMTYDSRGNLRTRTAPAPLGYQENWTYDSLNNVTSHTDGRGKTTSYGYNAHGDLTSLTGPDPDAAGPLSAPISQYGRDSTTGVLTSVTDPRNKTTSFGYTDGNLTSITTPLGRQTTMSYDSSGRMTAKVEPRGNSTGADPADYTSTYAYDDANHLTTQTDPLGNQTAWSYDPVGNLASLTDPNNHSTSYGYDNANELTTVTAPDNSQTSYGYDNNGNVLSRTDANNHAASYAYDDANRLTSMTKPGGESWNYSYDANGNLTSSVDANGNSTATSGDGTTSYGYDALNRLNTISYSGTTTPNVTFAYDADDNRTQMTDGAGTVNYTYDALNRITQVTRGTASFSYAYDAASNPTAETYPDSTAISYTYTDDEQLASVTSGGNSVSYGYNAAGALLTTTLPTGNGYVESRSYDRAGRLTSISNASASSILSAFAYTLDPAGNLTETGTTGATNGTTAYGYDSLDRLTSVCFQASCPNQSDPQTSWTYDDVGNRLTQTTPTATTNYTYNSDDELTAADATSYSYDANGNQTAAGATSYSYDLVGRLITTSNGATTTSYTYDGNGSRLQASAGSGAANTTNFTWEPAAGIPQLAIEQDGSGALTRRYLHGHHPISMTTGGTGAATFYYHRDGLGSITNLTDAAGNPQWAYDYDPFGTATATQNATGAPTNLFQFAGEYADPTGFYHLGAREYDATTGRFLTTDPANAATGSTYAYVDNQPTIYVDPTGLCRWCDPRKVIEAGANAIGDELHDASQHIPAFWLWPQKACVAMGAILADTAHTIVGTMEQVPHTLTAAYHHPGVFVASALSYSAAVSIPFGAWWVAGQVVRSAAAEAGLFEQLAGPVHGGLAFGGVSLISLVPGYAGYKGSQYLARH